MVKLLTSRPLTGVARLASLRDEDVTRHTDTVKCEQAEAPLAQADGRTP